MEERLKQLERQVTELLEWKQLKLRQQISIPLDEASRNVLAQAKVTSAGTFGTQSIALSGDAENINVPAQPSGTVIVEIEGESYEFLKK